MLMVKAEIEKLNWGKARYYIADKINVQVWDLGMANLTSPVWEEITNNIMNTISFALKEVGQ